MKIWPAQSLFLFAKSRFLQICAFVNLSPTIKFCKNQKNLQILVSEILQIWGSEFLQIWLAQSFIFFAKIWILQICALVSLCPTIKFCKNSKKMKICVTPPHLFFTKNLNFPNMCSRKFISNHQILQKWRILQIFVGSSKICRVLICEN